MKYTKVERHRIYKKALRLYCSKQRAIGNMYLCFVLDTATNGEYSHDYPLLLHNLPEVLDQKPSFETKFSMLVWFKPTDRKSRIAVLKKAIKLTTPKPKPRTKTKTKTKKITKS